MMGLLRAMLPLLLFSLFRMHAWRKKRREGLSVSFVGEEEEKEREGRKKRERVK